MATNRIMYSVEGRVGHSGREWEFLGSCLTITGAHVMRRHFATTNIPVAYGRTRIVRWNRGGKVREGVKTKKSIIKSIGK